MAESERSQKNKWLRVSGLGVGVTFASTILLIVISSSCRRTCWEAGLVTTIPVSILMATLIAGAVAVPIGFIGWLVTADTWRERFAPLGALLGVILLVLFGLVAALAEGNY